MSHQQYFDGLATHGQECVAATSAHDQSNLMSWAYLMILQWDQLVWAHCGRDGRNGPICTHGDYIVLIPAVKDDGITTGGEFCCQNSWNHVVPFLDSKEYPTSSLYGLYHPTLNVSNFSYCQGSSFCMTN